MTDTVIIAGGGPTGLTLACELRLAGVPVVVLEPQTERPEVSAGMAMHGRTLQVLTWRGLADRIGPGDMFAWPRTPFALLWLGLDVATEQDYTYAFPQWRLERLLEARAVELGADVRRGHALASLRQDGSGVTVTAVSDAGEYELSGAYLVGCDGAESPTRELAGIGFPAIDTGYYGVLGDMDMSEGAGHPFNAAVVPGGVLGAIPLSADRLRLMVVEFDTPRPADDVPVDEKELAASIGRLTGEEPALGEITWVSRFGSPTRLAERYRAGRVFLAGDAAHTLYVSGTQGVNAGVQDAVNLGWKLAAHLNGWAPEGLLDTYHAERHAVGERLCHHSAASMALVHPLEHVAQLRELFSELIELEDVNRHLLELPAGAHYPLDGDGAGDPPLGRPLPAAVPEIGGATAALRAGRGLLLDLTGRQDSGAAGLAAGWAGRVDVVTAAAPAGVPAGVLLARPDGYVAHADTAGTDRDGLRDALLRWFGDPATQAG